MGKAIIFLRVSTLSKKLESQELIARRLAHADSYSDDDILEPIKYKESAVKLASDSAELKITTLNHIVINWCNLRSTIKAYRTPCIMQEDIQRIINKISATNITTEGSRDMHISNVQFAQQTRESALANGKCPKCGGNLLKRKGKYGSFWGCSNYPKCKFTHNS